MSPRARRLPSLLVLALALVAGVALAAPRHHRKKKPPPPPPTAPMPQVKAHLSDRVRQSLATAEAVQAFRVASSGGLRPDPRKAIGSDFEREAEGKVLSADQLEVLRGLLYDDRSYRFRADVARCDFVPDVSFQVRAGIDTVEVLLSFRCNLVLFYLGKPGGRWLPGGTFDVRPARSKLIALAKETLPGDGPTQQLK